VENVVLKEIPEVSIIIPVFNHAERLEQCLVAPLQAKRERGWEVIVVDDASTDNTARVADRLGAQVVSLDRNQGVAIARNLGARAAHGDIFIFKDADVACPLETLYVLVDRLSRDARIQAVGACPAGNLSDRWTSKFLHLQVQWFVKRHVRSDENVSCFSSECGAIRRSIFEAAGGFPETYTGVGMEEFSLGHILERQGWKNILLPEAAYYTYYDTVTRRCSEILYRTSRWVPLFLKRRRLEPVLGSRPPLGDAVSCLLIFLLVCSAILGFLMPLFWWTPLIFIGMHFVVQLPWLFFVFRNNDGGIKVAILAWPVLILMHLSILAGFSLGVVRYLWVCIRPLQKS